MSMIRSTIANSKNSPLLRLPTEIRDKIFRYASTAEDGIICINFPHARRRLLSGRETIILPRVCRQIYSESATLCYTENTFELLRVSGQEVHGWINRRSEAQKRVIRRIQLNWAAYNSPRREKVKIPQNKTAEASYHAVWRIECPNLEPVVIFSPYELHGP